MKRLAIITTHPIQYNAPVFNMLQQRGKIQIKVFYTWGQSKQKDIYDPGFGINRAWDIPLLEGYDYEFLENVARNPGSHHFWGIQNPDIIQRIMEFAPSALLVYGWSFRSHLYLMRQCKNHLPVFFRGDSNWLDMDAQPWFKRILKRIFLSWVYSYIDKAFYVGTANQKYFSLCGLKNNQLIYAPHAIDNDRFHQYHETNEAKAKAWRDSLGIPENHFVFLFAGKLEKKKAPDLLIRAFINVRKKDITLIICGNGNLENALKAQAEGHTNIIFLPFQNQQKMPVLYRLGDAFVLPSRGPAETWGLSINEAMACGRPVIASDKCGAATDLIKEDETGYVFKSDSALDLTDKMNRMLNVRSAGNSLGFHAYQKIQPFSYESFCKAIESTI